MKMLSNQCKNLTENDMNKPAVIEHDQPLQAAPTTPATLLQIAVEQGADIDKLTKLMDLQERYEAKEAKKAYIASMSAFRAECPTIAKTREAHNSKYAGLAETIDQIKPLLASNGLSHAWKTDQDNGQVSVTCCVTHDQGHQECTTLTAGLDTSGSKNSIQSLGSTISYLERYTLYAVLGLASGDMDNDGATSEPVAVITDEQLLDLEAMISDNYEPPGAEKLKRWIASTMKISHLNEIRADRYDWLVKEIDKAIASRAKA